MHTDDWSGSLGLSGMTKAEAKREYYWEHGYTRVIEVPLTVYTQATQLDLLHPLAEYRYLLLPKELDDVNTNYRRACSWNVRRLEYGLNSSGPKTWRDLSGQGVLKADEVARVIPMGRGRFAAKSMIQRELDALDPVMRTARLAYTEYMRVLDECTREWHDWSLDFRQFCLSRKDDQYRGKLLDLLDTGWFDLSVKKHCDLKPKRNSRHQNE